MLPGAGRGLRPPGGGTGTPVSRVGKGYWGIGGPTRDYLL